MMKLAVVLAVFAVAINAAEIAEVTSTTLPPIPIVRQHMSNDNGIYKTAFETGHGIVVEENGSQKQVGELPEHRGNVASGSYSYTSPEGIVITVNWVADEKGFRAIGDHLPVPPAPLPVA